MSEEAPRLRGYRVVRKLGSGAGTDVYLAVRETDGAEVALKILDGSSSKAGTHLTQLIREYTLLSRIDHPNVIRIHDQGFSGGSTYIAMDYFEAGDLRVEIRAGMPAPRVLDVVRQLALALEVIHGNGIVHGDLKPENTMRRPDGSVVLADFGIARSMVAPEDVPDGIGTPFYASPEQAAGKVRTPRSDLYSLGVMMFEMLAGRRPFVAESLEGLLARHLTAPTPALPPLHAWLQPVVDRLMAKRPEDRYASAGGLLQALTLTTYPSRHFL